jgi:hypothetical protein
MSIAIFVFILSIPVLSFLLFGFDDSLLFGLLDFNITFVG